MAITLKAARVNAGLTQKQAAKEIGVSVSSITKWESGKSAPSTKYIPKITATYKTTYDDLIFLSSVTL